MSPLNTAPPQPTPRPTCAAVVSADEFTEVLSLRERTHSAAPYTPSEPLDTVPEGAFAIESVNEKYHRAYVRRESAAATEQERVAASG